MASPGSEPRRSNWELPRGSSGQPAGSDWVKRTPWTVSAGPTGPVESGSALRVSPQEALASRVCLGLGVGPFSGECIQTGGQQAGLTAPLRSRSPFPSAIAIPARIVAQLRRAARAGQDAAWRYRLRGRGGPRVCEPCMRAVRVVWSACRGPSEGPLRSATVLLACERAAHAPPVRRGALLASAPRGCRQEHDTAARKFTPRGSHFGSQRAVRSRGWPCAAGAMRARAVAAQTGRAWTVPERCSSGFRRSARRC